jgi:hypothetical protein
MTPNSRIPLKEAIRRYWMHLLPVPFFAPFVCYLFRFTHDAVWAIPVTFFVFFSVTTFAAWPVIRYRAAMSFWNFGGLLYVAGGFLMYAFCELFLKFV